MVAIPYCSFSVGDQSGLILIAIVGTADNCDHRLCCIVLNLPHKSQYKTSQRPASRHRTMALPFVLPESAVLGGFVKFWDPRQGIDSDQDPALAETTVHPELTATAVGGLLYDMRDERQVRQRVKRQMESLGLSEGVHFETRKEM